MSTIIDKPDKLNKGIIDQLVNLVCTGGQVERRFIEKGVIHAELVALYIDNNKIISSATLKNSLRSYIDKVFISAGVKNRKDDFTQELGYIVTHPAYEGQKLCQKLLTDFFPLISTKNIFATTRKSSMAHILTKFAFTKLGDCYNKDLNLFIYNGKS